MKRALAAFALSLLATTPAFAGDPLICIAPTEPAEAGNPLAEAKSLEFYVDEGDPLKSFSRSFVLQGGASQAQGRVRNQYRVGSDEGSGTIVFAGDAPVSFAIEMLNKTYTSVGKNDDETRSMVDAVPGIVCYTVTPADPL